MRGRVLTLHLRQRLTPDERRRLQRALQVMPEEPEPPTQRIGGRVCHGEIAHPWTVRLAIRLGDFVCQQLSEQEGFRVDFKAAILDSGRNSTLIWWGLPEEVVVVPWEMDCAGPSFLISARPHPPIFRLPREERYPMEVPYRVSAGVLAGRSGSLRVWGLNRIQDRVLMMS